MKKVITYGTFDLFHIGHYNILKRAKEYGDYLIVGVTGENYDVERGKLSVQDSLSKRIENVKKTGFADLIIVEEYLGQKISDIVKYNIDVFVIGSDWKGKFDHLNKYCDVVYLERTKDISSTQLRQQYLNIYKMGIVTDTIYDNYAVIESKNVSGIHVQSVFSEDKITAQNFALKYELDRDFFNYEDFLNTIDIVYIKSSQMQRDKYIRKALEHKKHVICDVPLSLDYEECKNLITLAKRNNLMIFENVPMLYLQSFGQLLWMVKGNIIGDILSFKCSISKNNFNNLDKKSIMEIVYYPICAVLKLLGNKYKDCKCKTVKNDVGDFVYGAIELIYSKGTAFIETGIDVSLEDSMVIVGTEGTIHVPDDWWNLGYFKVKRRGEHKFKRYSFNFDGNGFRYIIKRLLQTINNKHEEAYQMNSAEDLQALYSLLDKLKEDVKN